MAVSEIVGNQDVADPIQHIPFVVHIRVVPYKRTGKRTEYLRNLEKKAKRVQADLVADGWNIATPIAYAPQFGDFSARLTIVGSWTKTSTTDGRQNTAPTTTIDVIHSGTDPGEKTSVYTGNVGGSLSYGQDPITTVDAEVAELRSALVASTSEFDAHDIVHIEYNGVQYGIKKIGGRSFPK